MLELWLVVCGSLVHGVYGWSGSNTVVGLFVPINESVWEHFKLGYAALLLWQLRPSGLRSSSWKDELLPMAAGLIVINLVIVAIFFTARTLATDFAMRLSIDIGSYVLGCLAAGQIVRRWKPTFNGHRTFGVLVWLCIGITFAVLTVWPPQLPLFIEGGLGR